MIFFPPQVCCLWAVSSLLHSFRGKKKSAFKGMLAPFDHTCLLLLSLSHGRFCVQMLCILHRAIDIMGVKHKIFPGADVRKH